MAGKRFLGSRNLSLYVGRSATKYHPDRSSERRSAPRTAPRRILEILHESIRNRPLWTESSNPCGVYVKEKPPLPGALISNGAAYRIPRIRCADPHRLRPPAGALARGLKTLRVFFTPAPRPRFESMRCRRKRKAPVTGELSISNGAAYRIRTYDVLIRSQTLYPAEVTPRLVDYYAHRLNKGQAIFEKSYQI